MTIEHNLITDPEIHEPKGIATASVNQVYISDGVGTGTWTDQLEPFDPSTMNIETVLDATSVAASQQPVGTDTALQLEFGPAQHTTADPVMIAANGTITFNESGSYRVDLVAHYGRTGGAGTAIILSRAVVNGIGSSNSLVAKLDDADVLIPYSNESRIYVTAGTTMAYEIMRDSAGTNSGGLFQTIPTTGWNAAPTASITITRLTA